MLKKITVGDDIIAKFKKITYIGNIDYVIDGDIFLSKKRDKHNCFKYNKYDSYNSRNDNNDKNRVILWMDESNTAPLL